ncbi:MAG: T9SS type A sorting domain-containing protein, partial [candidate division WOR-3 bacterium]|nr:T9SS type A sorting domain-containing protein [candidate division WOR-3 bacterium]
AGNYIEWHFEGMDNTDGWTIERRTENFVFSAISHLPADANSYTDSDIAANTCYYYRVMDIYGTIVSADIRILSGKPSIKNSMDCSYDNSTVNVSYNICQNDIVNISLYSITGQYIKGTGVMAKEPGMHNHAFNASTLPSGIYFVKMKTAGSIFKEKLLIVK